MLVTFDEVFGAVKHNNQFIVATNSSLLIIDDRGSIIDEITTLDGLTEAPLGISLSKDGSAILRGASKYWASKNDLFNWREYTGEHPVWVTSSITLPALRQVIETNDMGRQISLERFLLDAHSGRFFGKYGVYVIDIAALLLLILSITGIWLWATRR